MVLGGGGLLGAAGGSWGPSYGSESRWTCRASLQPARGQARRDGRHDASESESSIWHDRGGGALGLQRKMPAREQNVNNEKMKMSIEVRIKVGEGEAGL